MSISTLGRSLKRSRTHMINDDVDANAEKFTKHFRMTDGDYIEFERWRPGADSQKILTRGRIVCVEDVFVNRGGNYTARVKVVPLLVSGQLGNSRGVVMVIDPDGCNLRGLSGGIIRKVSSGST